MTANGVRLYLYSNKNLVGLALAALALVAYLLGVIGLFWWAITIGAYVLGALATPPNPKLDVALSRQMSDAELLAGLDSLAKRAPKVLPADIAADVVSICSTLQAELPLLTRRGIEDQTAYDVRTSATQYLPETLDAYLKMPPAFRAMARVQDGKTPTQMLGEQVKLLRSRLEMVAQSLASDDSAALAENGRFLRDRFATPDFSELTA